MNQDYFDYATGVRMVPDRLWEELFGFKKRAGESELEQVHCDLALAIQKVTEEIVLKLAQAAKKLTGSKNICLAGGVALNCVANGKLLESGLFDGVWVQPAAGDAGGALGAAQVGHHIFASQPRTANGDKMRGSYCGPEFSFSEIEKILDKYGAVAKNYENTEHLCQETATLLSQEKVVGWFQGRMEWGPRALGHRSILADPRSAETQKKLNLKIKYRESFRPFAPSVLAEDLNDYFELSDVSPYMLLVGQVKKERCHQLPENFHGQDLREKLYFVRSDIPAITHLDFSARVQTVHKEFSPIYWELIQQFKKQTGYGLVVNTSFNVRGEPIVCTPEDAYRCFMRTEMDVLVLNNYVLLKDEQPPWHEEKSWREEYVLD